MRTHTGASTEFSFTGEQNDPNGLEYLRARYYDPAIGRFLGQDPAEPDYQTPGTLNRFVYVLNNPANVTDPTGLHCTWVHPHHCIAEGAERAGDYTFEYARNAASIWWSNLNAWIDWFTEIGEPVMDCWTAEFDWLSWGLAAELATVTADWRMYGYALYEQGLAEGRMTEACNFQG